MGEAVGAISAEPLDVIAAMATVSEPESGAVAVFIGTVRATAAGGGRVRRVVGLEYDAHPTLAAEKLQGIAEQASTKWNLTRIVAIHRSGRCAVGEPTVVIACSSAHRAEALEACHWVIDALKDGVPIWKRELYVDGSSWIEPVRSA